MYADQENHARVILVIRTAIDSQYTLQTPAIPTNYPIWTYVASNRQLILGRQNVIPAIIVDAYRYSRNDHIHRDLGVKLVSELKQDFAETHK